MRAENKIFRIAVLVLGYIFYYVFFVVVYSSSSKKFFFDWIDLSDSFVSEFLHDFIDNLFYKRMPYEIQSLIEFIVIFGVHAGYLYYLWFYRENIVVFIKNFIKKI